MTTTTNTELNREIDGSKWRNAIAYSFSLVMGMVAGLGLLIGGQMLADSTVGATIVNVLAITEKTPWQLSRAAGTVAYGLLAGSTVWGLLLSTKAVKTIIPPAVTLAVHNILSWLTIVLTSVHALALLGDSYYTYTLADLTLPFIGPYRPGWVGLGVIGFYLMFITSLSFSFRKQIGQKRWRKLHYATFGVYALATVHGLMAGTDSGSNVLQWLYWGSGAAVLLLTLYRIRLSNP